MRGTRDRYASGGTWSHDVPNDHTLGFGLERFFLQQHDEDNAILSYAILNCGGYV